MYFQVPTVDQVTPLPKTCQGIVIYILANSLLLLNIVTEIIVTSYCHRDIYCYLVYNCFLVNNYCNFFSAALTHSIQYTATTIVFNNCIKNL